MALRAVEHAVGRVFVGPQGQPGSLLPRADWARVYWLFEREFDLRPPVLPVRRFVRRVGLPHQH